MALIVQPKIKYLTNKDLLEEIHRSKTTYCSFVDPIYAKYDFIVNNKALITPERLEEARKKKLDTMLSVEKKAQVAKGIKDPKLTFTLDDVPLESIVIRLMTFDHIPPSDDEKLAKAKKESERHLKCNFPPYQHFIMKDGVLTCVLKSHWKGGMENGYFSKDHGKMTNNLAMMFMKLVERYGHRGNWRGYCVDKDTEALTKRGWLKYDQITEDDQILSYTNGTLIWSNIKSIFRDQYEGLMHNLTSSSIDALITPEHKMVTDRGLVKAELLKEKDKLIILGQAENNNNQVYSDHLVELLGWIVTEGCYEKNEHNEIKRITIYQNFDKHADKIRSCLTALNMKFSESDPTKNKNICFAISRADSREICKILPVKNLNMELITSLTTSQRELLIDTMINGDGWRTNGHRRYVQKDKEHVDLFRILCALSGIKTSISYKTHMSFGKQTGSYSITLFSKKGYHSPVENIDFNGGKRNGRDRISGRGKESHPNEPTTFYKGMVWCPETEYGCFVARRNELIYLTGNTYLEEMKSQALLQLSQVGLQFDESRSDIPNPFAYYTQTMSNSFMRILNIEKKNQNIRDDILIMHGSLPSYTRQTEDSMKQNGDQTPKS